MDTFTSKLDVPAMASFAIVLTLAQVIVAAVVWMVVGSWKSARRPSPAAKKAAGRESTDPKSLARVSGDDQFRKLIERVPAIVYTCDMGIECTCHYVSPQIRNILGFEPEDWLNDRKFWFSRVVSEDRPKVMAEEERASVTGIFRCTYRMTRKDGRVIEVQDDGKVIYDENGDPHYLQGFMYDVTEQNAAAALLKASETRFTEFMKNLPGVAFIKDADGRYVYFNDAWRALFPADVKMEIGMDGAHLFSPDDYRELRANDTKVLEGDEPAQIVESIPQPSGTRYYLVCKFPMRGDNGQKLLGGVAVDITDRRRAEEQFVSIFNNAVEGIFRTSPEGNYLAANPMLAKIYGYETPDELKNSVADISRQLYVDDSRRQDFRKLMDAQSVITNFESEIFRKDGSRIWISENAWKVCDERGNLQYYEGTVVDITAVKQNQALDLAKQQAEAARADAEDASRAKSEFLANMSHEIRTPMTAILGYTDLLFDELRETPKAAEWLAIMRRNGNHLLSIINDILDLSKIEAGKMTVEKITASPCQIVADVASLMRARAMEKKLAFSCEYIGNVPETIQTDPTRLRQILINLVSNAIKFTQHGGVHVVTRVLRTEDEHGGAIMAFDIVDSGMGLSAEQQSKLFEAFMQTDTSHTRRFGGTGLGLAISRKLAQMLGGDITIKSDPGQGSTFTVTVDAGALAGVRMIQKARESLVPAFEEGTPLGDTGAPLPTLKGRILLAEDGPDNQQMISLILRKAGADVTVAENGKVAVEKALTAVNAGEPFDLILMDMQMPEQDGYSATRELRARNYRLPVIALTAHAMASDRQRCLDAGCDEYATKPVDRRALLGLANRFMGSKKGGSDSVDAGFTHPPLYSDLSNDPDLLSAVMNFTNVLPSRLSSIQKALDDKDLETLARLAHQLKGSAGTFGYMPITHAAAALEQGAKTRQAVEKLVEFVRSLETLIKRVRAAGVPGSGGVSSAA